jgi:drug/metabolite transporter (DMT)-like permease
LDAVLLAATSALLFGVMTVAIRIALVRGAGAETGALFAVLVALVVTLPFTFSEGVEVAELWPFLLAGLLGPGLSTLLFVLAVREAGPSRTSVAVGTAPLFSVAIALVFLDEMLEAGLVAGALLIVGGGVLLAGERDRPEHVRVVGLVLALAATVAFAIRDNFVRWLAIDTDVAPGAAASATLLAGAALIAVYVGVTGARLRARDARAFIPAGIVFGLSYICLFEAYYRGPVTVVSPLVATESLWGVVVSVLVLKQSEGVGARLVAGAVLVVCGGILIGAVR